MEVGALTHSVNMLNNNSKGLLFRKIATLKASSQYFRGIEALANKMRPFYTM